MPSIDRKSFSGHEALVLRSDEGASVTILPEFGGAVHELRLVDSTGEPREILVGDTVAELVPNPHYRGRFLFPFCGRIPGGRYRWLGRERHLSINEPDRGNALHGFLYRKAMEAVEKCADGAGAILKLRRRVGAEEEAGYPFPMEVTIDYRLDAEGFSISFAATNEGRLPAPLSFGWHPYFRCPEGLARSTLTMATEGHVPLDRDLIPRGNIEAASGTFQDYSAPRSPDSPGLDRAFHTPRAHRMILSPLPGWPLVIVEAERGAFPYTQLYAPPWDTRLEPSLAIEPVSAAANAFNEPGLGLRVLEPGATCRGTIKVSLGRDLI